MWTKLADVKQAQLQDVLGLGCLVLFITFGITHYSLFIIVIAIFIIYLVSFIYFNRTVGHKVELINLQQSIRLYPEDEATLTLTLLNHAPYPYLNGKLLFEASDAISLDAPLSDASSYSISVTLYPKKKTSIKIPVTALTRGTGRIYNIRFQFAHLLKFQQTTLRYNPYFQQTFIVFPKSEPLPNLSQTRLIRSGEKIVNFSPFEDPGQIQGIRDYEMSDSFRRINWKASLKAQHLQANHYEKVTEKTFHIVINIEYIKSQGRLMQHPKTEVYYQYAAYLISLFEKTEAHYALSVNIRKLGQMPFLSIARGHGQAHQLKMLEQLARIHRRPLIYPAQKMIYQLGDKQNKPQVIILIGVLSPSMLDIIAKSWPNTYQVFHLSPDEPVDIRPVQIKGRAYGS